MAETDTSRASVRGKIKYCMDGQTIKEIITDYDSGMSGDQAAAKHHVSRWLVFKLVRENGGTPVKDRVLCDRERSRS